MSVVEIENSRGQQPISEELSLRFVNTVAWRLREPPEERLPAPDNLLDWFELAGLATADYCGGLRARWSQHPDEAWSLHRRAVALREAAYQLLRSHIAGEPVPHRALVLFNSALAARASGLRVAAVGHHLAWRPLEPASPTDLLKPIAWSAVELLTGPRSSKIRQCQDDRGCGLVFIDDSRAQNRRWCSMGDCGNRAKAHRHYLRHRRVAGSRTGP